MFSPRLLLLNILSWSCGIGLLVVVFLGFDALLADGFVKTALQWIAAAVAVTFFGGLPLRESRNKRG